ncbi:hypothetical protein GALMADRAFT_217595 [Galerina marginata CBS 339.88]|uniref:Uncharacterized protein n=1 Tax=Galerina marginata (strain CBS 339.88) TaxID=685588 RepID=A0A067S653_GALM3|nr:hypothetical protein GALMADRAFT_217595 [Galerina marginata CBS 339.88]
MALFTCLYLLAFLVTYANHTDSPPITTRCKEVVFIETTDLYPPSDTVITHLRRSQEDLATYNPTGGGVTAIMCSSPSVTISITFPLDTCTQPTGIGPDLPCPAYTHLPYCIKETGGALPFCMSKFEPLHSLLLDSQHRGTTSTALNSWSYDLSTISRPMLADSHETVTGSGLSEPYLCAHHCVSSVSAFGVRAELALLNIRRHFVTKLVFWFEMNSVRIYEPNGWNNVTQTWLETLLDDFVGPTPKNVHVTDNYTVIIPSNDDTEGDAPERHSGGGLTNSRKKIIKGSLLQQFIDPEAGITVLDSDYELVDYMDDAELDAFAEANPRCIPARMPIHLHAEYLGVPDIRTLGNRHGIFIHSKLNRKEATSKFDLAHHCDTCDSHRCVFLPRHKEESRLFLSEIRQFVRNADSLDLDDHEDIIIRAYRRDDEPLDIQGAIKADIPLRFLCDSQPLSLLRDVAKLHGLEIANNARARKVIGSLKKHSCINCPSFVCLIQTRPKRSSHMKLADLREYIQDQAIPLHEDRVVTFVGYQNADECMDVDNTIKANIPLHVLCNFQPLSSLRSIAELHGVSHTGSSAKMTAALSRHDCSNCQKT